MAADLSPADRDLFETHVRPTLVQHCIKCHGDDKQEGGLRLTSIAGLLAGGDSGPAIVVGKPAESLLLEALRYESLEMPPSGQLEPEVADGIARWIKAGSPWPQGLVLKPTPKIADRDRDWWSYQPIANPAIPTVKDPGWCRNEIDYFILSRLEREGLQPSPAAPPARLARRVHFAATGLPPDEKTRLALEHIQNIASHDDWYPALVDRLLEDPAYGEHQARPWLDLVRYADSDGYNADHGRPEAHHYRDYVIRSFNDDKPYDRFIVEQLAGDEVDPGNRDALIGTMYLRHWIYEWNQRDVEGQWREILSDVTETTADAFLALGLKCARCHDHKFDPLLQKDYYALKAFFAPLQPREDQPVADIATRTKHFRQQRAWEVATEEIRARLHDIETPPLLAHATREGFTKFTKEIQAMIAARRGDRSAYEHQIASLASNQFDLHPEKLAEWLDKETEAERQQLLQRLAEFDHLKPQPLPIVKFVASDVGPVAPPVTIPDADDPTPIAPAYPTILSDRPATITPPPEALQSTGRRTALARWITSPNNPLTARVLVNRVWQQHFGRGLVETTSDFGHLGAPPSHPQLLDWLARRFMNDGWSIKKLHRLILMSATFRQSSQRAMDEHLAMLDPQNALLWRMNPRRLSGEEIHDAVLAASGQMGPGKRAIYKPVKRNQLDPFLAAFDFPDRVQSECKRHRTTTSPQALMLMNDPWLHERAQDMANTIGPVGLDSLVRSAYQRLYFRQPGGDELQQALHFHASYQTMTPEAKPLKRLATLPDGRPAIALTAKQPVSLRIPSFHELSTAMTSGGFTIEATVLLHSLYPDASVRTIAASWTGDKTAPGWSLGVTSAKSAYKPLNLILQLVGAGDEGEPRYEVVASGLHLELNTPYHVVASIDLDETTNQGVTFSLRDLSKPDSKPRTASVAHHAGRNVQSSHPVEIGGRANQHRWDGLIHSVRLYGKVHGPGAGLVNDSVAQEPANEAADLLLDIRFGSERQLGQDVSGHDRHALLIAKDAATPTPSEQARVALLHALLCSNELIYVD